MLLAVGILGATVMPHVIYLHSALTQDRIVAGVAGGRARRCCATRGSTSLIAMTLAGLINLSMLVMAASTFCKSGLPDVDSLEGAHETLEPILGPTAERAVRDRAARLRASRRPPSGRSRVRS